MTERQVRMLNTALEILIQDAAKVHEWTLGETQATGQKLDETGQQILSDLRDDRDNRIRGLDDALHVYMQARNDYGESDESGFPELTITFAGQTFWDWANPESSEK